MAAIALLAVWALNPTLYLLNSLVGQFKQSSSVQTSAIEAPAHALEVCSHHQHGCPKDCFCPKLTLNPESVAEPVNLPGILHEPSLSQCSEERAALDSPPVAKGFLIPAVDPMVFCLEVGTCPIPPRLALLDAHSEPPRKIPIA